MQNSKFSKERSPTASDHGDDVLYEIGKSDTVGRHMVASRDIQPGEVIFFDQPACIGPDNSSRPMCLGCHRKLTGAYECPKCEWPMCREECSRSAIHKAECEVFSEKKSFIKIPWFDKPCSYYDAILPIRVLLLKKSNPKVYRLVTLLMDHNDNLDEATKKYRQKVIDFIRKTCKLADEFTEDEVQHVLGILSVNSFVVRDTNEDHLDLIGLYPWTSLMSHHCSPNTIIITGEDFSYTCVAATFIPKGEEIVTSYHHYYYHFFGTAYRRKELKSVWSFDCGCKRCSDPSEFQTMVSAVLCDKCKFGYLLPKDSSDYESIWSCDYCSNETPAQDMTDKMKKFEDEIEDIKSEDAESYEKMLRKMRYFLHENHYWILDVKRRLIDIYGNKPGFEIYKLPKETLEKKIDFCNHLLEMAAKLCPGGSEMRGYLLWELHVTRLRLLQWKWIRMRITCNQYEKTLKELMVNLKEIVSILGQIRVNSSEGEIGLKAKEEIHQLENTLSELSVQTRNSPPITSSYTKRSFNSPSRKIDYDLSSTLITSSSSASRRLSIGRKTILIN